MKYGTLNAEVIWCLKLTDSRLSYHSSREVVSIQVRRDVISKWIRYLTIFYYVHAVNIVIPNVTVYFWWFVLQNVPSSFQCEKKVCILVKLWHCLHFLSLLIDRVKDTWRMDTSYSLIKVWTTRLKKQLDAHVGFWDTDMCKSLLWHWIYGRAPADDFMRDVDHITAWKTLTC